MDYFFGSYNSGDVELKRMSELYQFGMFLFQIGFFIVP
jgi:hypothetical protein